MIAAEEKKSLKKREEGREQAKLARTNSKNSPEKTKRNPLQTDLKSGIRRKESQTTLANL